MEEIDIYAVEQKCPSESCDVQLTFDPFSY